MADGIVVVSDNTEQAEAALESAIERALEAVGMQAESHAKAKCPVDTGRLRNSITHVRQGNAVYIGTNVEYAPYVELGTSRRKEKPFLRPAAQDHGSEYRAIIEAMLKNG